MCHRRPHILKLILFAKKVVEFHHFEYLGFRLIIIINIYINFKTVNIVDAYKDTRFDPSVDEGGPFRHSSILCMPIRNTATKIVGVVQLINKFDQLPFTSNDENFLEAFAIFCGMGIHNTHM